MTLARNAAYWGAAISAGVLSEPTLASCIVWGNGPGDHGVWGHTHHSCLAGAWGDGDIEADPLFCGWIEAFEVHVDPSVDEPGDGSSEHPFSELRSAFEDYSFSLSSER